MIGDGLGPPQSTASVMGPPQSTASVMGPPQSTASVMGPPQSTASVLGSGLQGRGGDRCLGSPWGCKLVSCSKTRSQKRTEVPGSSQVTPRLCSAACFPGRGAVGWTHGPWPWPQSGRPSPPALISHVLGKAFARRDRRWCLTNVQQARARPGNFCANAM